MLEDSRCRTGKKGISVYRPAILSFDGRTIMGMVNINTVDRTGFFEPDVDEVLTSAVPGARLVLNDSAREFSTTCRACDGGLSHLHLDQIVPLEKPAGT